MEQHFVTITATFLTLLVNSMAAFALAKYKFPGRQAIFLTMIATLMVPLSVVLVPIFLVITRVGWNNNLLGIIVPVAATPTGVFLLRQYMLTIPNELIDAARIDGASEWRIYAQIILPLAKPALAVLAIFSVMWRWNDFLWPLIVMSRSEYFTLQVGLAAFQGEHMVQWNLILAMTVLTFANFDCICHPAALHHHRHCHHGTKIERISSIKEHGIDLTSRRYSAAKGV
jgi:alpha-1,4-digalacturonate transport system permease protein